MLERLDVDDPKAAAVFVQPRQRKVILALVDGERSLGELARMTDMPLSLLHHHVGKFVRLGLVAQTRREPRAGSPVRYYRAAARAFFVPAEIMATTPGVEMSHHLRATLDRRLSRTLKGVLFTSENGALRMRQVRDAPSREVCAETWMELALPPQDAAELATALRQLIQAFASRSRPGAPRHIVHTAVVEA